MTFGTQLIALGHPTIHVSRLFRPSKSWPLKLKPQDCIFQPLRTQFMFRMQFLTLRFHFPTSRLTFWTSRLENSTYRLQKWTCEVHELRSQRFGNQTLRTRFQRSEKSTYMNRLLANNLLIKVDIFIPFIFLPLKMIFTSQ